MLIELSGRGARMHGKEVCGVWRGQLSVGLVSGLFGACHKSLMTGELSCWKVH